MTLLRDDLFRVRSGSDHAKAVSLATCPPLCVGALWPMPAWAWRDVLFLPVLSSFQSYPCCGCHGWSWPVPSRPCCCTGTSPPLAHEAAMSGLCHGSLAWCVVCGVHPPASVRVRVGEPSPCCLFVRPLVVAPPAARFCICPCDCSCFVNVRPCALVRCPSGSGVMSDLCNVFCTAYTRQLVADAARAATDPRLQLRSTYTRMQGSTYTCMQDSTYTGIQSLC